MPGPGFGRREARRHRGQRGQGDLFDLHAGGAQRRECALKGAGNSRVERIEHHGGGHGQSKGRGGLACERDLAIGEHLVQEHRITHRSGDRAGGVERGRERNRTFGRCQPCGVLEADQPLQCRRNADRATRVGAERRPRGAGRDRDRAAGGRAAGNARLGVELRRDRVHRRTEMRVDADGGEGELGHVGPADESRAGCSQARDGRAICDGWWAGCQHDRTCRCDFVQHVEQVFHADGQAGQGQSALPGCSPDVDRTRRLGSRIERSADKRVPVRVGSCRLDGRVEQLSGGGTLARAGQVRGHRNAMIEWLRWVRCFAVPPSKSRTGY